MMKTDDKNWVIAIIEDKINHLHPSPATKEEFKSIYVEINALKREKVGWDKFYWIVGIIFMFMTIILSSIWVQVRENGKLTNTNNSTISRIEGILEGALE